MENASKALIIAGSILLSILIIALGMYIFSTSSSTSNVEILNETEIQTYNAKFEKYKGSQLGSNVDSLIAALRSNYTTNNGSQEKIPTVTFDKATTTTADYANKGSYITTISDWEFESSHRYNVEMSYGKDGLIETIAITYN